MTVIVYTIEENNHVVSRIYSDVGQVTDKFGDLVLRQKSGTEVAIPIGDIHKLEAVP